jgi:hypothetical protein
MPGNAIEQVRTFLNRLEDQINTIEGVLNGHPNALTSELLILRQISYTATGILRPDSRHVPQETTDEVAALTARARAQLAVARKCLDDGRYAHLYSELSILRHIATAAVGAAKNPPP